MGRSQVGQSNPLATVKGAVVASLMAGGLEIIREEEAEANEIIVTHSGLIFEIQLGHFCNNRCNFCTSGYLTEIGLAQKIELDPILEAIKGGRDRGATRLIFLGGEPTLHDGFLDALRYAVEIGFREVVIFTNGARMGRPKFIESCLELGSFEWRISIQGATEEVHDLTTGLKGAFGRIRKGLKTLSERGQKITTNMCVCTSNYESVVHFPALVRATGISQLHLDVVRPMSTPIDHAGGELSSVMPRHSAIAPFMRTMLEGFAKTTPGFDVNVGNLPFCFLPEWGNRMEHGGEETITQPADGDGLEEQVNKYEWHKSARVKPAECSRCVFNLRCTGVYREYAELYGTGELVPLSFTQLEELDIEQRSFPLVAGAWFEELSRAAQEGECPRGWRVEGWEPDHRRRCIELLMVSDSGGFAKALIHPVKDPPGCSPTAWTLVRGSRFTLRLEGSPLLTEAELRPLVEWIGHWTPEAERSEIDVERFLGAHFHGERLQASVGRLARSLRSFEPEPGWVCGSPVVRDDGLSASLEYRKQVAGEGVLALVLKLYPLFEGARSRVGVALEMPPTTPKVKGSPAARSLIARLKRELTVQG